MAAAASAAASAAAAAAGPARAAIRRIGLLTGGGDAPGLNAVIRAVVLAAAREGWEVTGIRDGFDGLLAARPAGGVCALTPDDVHGIAHLGGTILGSSVNADPFHYPQLQPDGTVLACDRSGDVLAQCERLGLDALVAVGGDGTMAIADGLARQGLRVVGVPKTIDNDLDHTVVTFGFDTAVAFATECIDRLHSTAQSHRRIMVVETMGRYAGWIALHAGLAGGAHAILIPEIPFDLEPVARLIAQRDRAGRAHSIVVVAEGACPAGGARSLLAAGAAGQPERLGGIGQRVAQALQDSSGKEAREVMLGHLLRGGSPSACDRVYALRFGAAAVRALAAGQHGVMLALGGSAIGAVPLAEVAGRNRRVPLDGDTIATARALGVCLGDAPVTRGLP